MRRAQRWSIDFGPQNEVTDQRVRDVIFENNHVTADNDVYISLLALGEDITVRNNLFERPSGDGYIAVDSRIRGVHPAPSRVHVFNNTGYVESGVLDFWYFSEEVLESTVANNLYISPEPARMIDGEGDTVVEGNMAASPNDLVSGDPASWQDFRVTEGASAVGQSLSEYTPTWDFGWAPRPSEAAVGALEPSP